MVVVVVVMVSLHMVNNVRDSMVCCVRAAGESKRITLLMATDT